MIKLPFPPYLAVESIVLVVATIIPAIVKNEQPPLQRFHRVVTRHRLSLSGRHLRSPAITIDPLPGAGQATPAAWHSLSLSDRSFP